MVSCGGSPFSGRGASCASGGTGIVHVAGDVYPSDRQSHMRRPPVGPPRPRLQPRAWGLQVRAWLFAYGRPHPPSFSQRDCPRAARLSKASHVPTRGPWSAGAAIHQARVVVSPDEDLVAPVHDLVLDDNHSMGDVCERRLSKLSITKLHDSANPRSSRSSYSLLTPFAVFVATVGDSPPPSAGLTTTSCARSAEVAMRDWAYSHCRLIFDSHRGSASKLTFTVTSCALLTIADTRAAVV